MLTVNIDFEIQHSDVGRLFKITAAGKMGKIILTIIVTVSSCSYIGKTRPLILSSDDLISPYRFKHVSKIY